MGKEMGFAGETSAGLDARIEEADKTALVRGLFRKYAPEQRNGIREKRRLFKGWSDIDSFDAMERCVNATKAVTKLNEDIAKLEVLDKSNEETSTCPECKLTFFNETHLKYHKQFVLNDNSPDITDTIVDFESSDPATGMLFCPWCPSLLQGPLVFIHHMKSCREKGNHQVAYRSDVSDDLFCPDCQKVYVREEDLWRHVYVTHGRPYKCNGCADEFTSKSKFKTHITVCTGEGQPMCSDCHEKFRNRRGGLLRHITLNPHCKLIEPYVCVKCSISLSNRKLMLTHIWKHIRIVRSKSIPTPSYSSKAILEEVFDPFKIPDFFKTRTPIKPPDPLNPLQSPECAKGPDYEYLKSPESFKPSGAEETLDGFETSDLFEHTDPLEPYDGFDDDPGQISDKEKEIQGKVPIMSKTHRKRRIVGVVRRKAQMGVLLDHPYSMPPSPKWKPKKSSPSKTGTSGSSKKKVEDGGKSKTKNVDGHPAGKKSSPEKNENRILPKKSSKPKKTELVESSPAGPTDISALPQDDPSPWDLGGMPLIQSVTSIDDWNALPDASEPAPSSLKKRRKKKKKKAAVGENLLNYLKETGHDPSAYEFVFFSDSDEKESDIDNEAVVTEKPIVVEEPPVPDAEPLPLHEESIKVFPEASAETCNNVPMFVTLVDNPSNICCVNTPWEDSVFENSVQVEEHKNEAMSHDQATSPLIFDPRKPPEFPMHSTSFSKNSTKKAKKTSAYIRLKDPANTDRWIPLTSLSNKEMPPVHSFLGGDRSAVVQTPPDGHGLMNLAGAAKSNLLKKNEFIISKLSLLEDPNIDSVTLLNSPNQITQVLPPKGPEMTITRILLPVPREKEVTYIFEDGLQACNPMLLQIPGHHPVSPAPMIFEMNASENSINIFSHEDIHSLAPDNELDRNSSIPPGLENSVKFGNEARSNPIVLKKKSKRAKDGEPSQKSLLFEALTGVSEGVKNAENGVPTSQGNLSIRDLLCKETISDENEKDVAGNSLIKQRTFAVINESSSVPGMNIQDKGGLDEKISNPPSPSCLSVDNGNYDSPLREDYSPLKDDYSPLSDDNSQFRFDNSPLRDYYSPLKDDYSPLKDDNSHLNAHSDSFQNNDLRAGEKIVMPEVKVLLTRVDDEENKESSVRKNVCNDCGCTFTTGDALQFHKSTGTCALTAAYYGAENGGSPKPVSPKKNRSAEQRQTIEAEMTELSSTVNEILPVGPEENSFTNRKKRTCECCNRTFKYAFALNVHRSKMLAKANVVPIPVEGVATNGKIQEDVSKSLADRCDVLSLDSQSQCSDSEIEGVDKLIQILDEDLETSSKNLENTDDANKEKSNDSTKVEEIETVETKTETVRKVGEVVEDVTVTESAHRERMRGWKKEPDVVIIPESNGKVDQQPTVSLGSKEGVTAAGENIDAGRTVATAPGGKTRRKRRWWKRPADADDTPRSNGRSEEDVKEGVVIGTGSSVATAPGENTRRKRRWWKRPADAVDSPRSNGGSEEDVKEGVAIGAGSTVATAPGKKTQRKRRWWKRPADVVDAPRSTQKTQQIQDGDIGLKEDIPASEDGIVIDVDNTGTSVAKEQRWKKPPDEVDVLGSTGKTKQTLDSNFGFEVIPTSNEDIVIDVGKIIDTARRILAKSCTVGLKLDKNLPTSSLSGGKDGISVSTLPSTVSPSTPLFTAEKEGTSLATPASTAERGATNVFTPSSTVDKDVSLATPTTLAEKAESPKSSLSPGGSELPVYACSFCYREFSSRGSLRMHLVWERRRQRQKRRKKQASRKGAVKIILNEADKPGTPLTPSVSVESKKSETNTAQESPQPSKNRSPRKSFHEASQRILAMKKCERVRAVTNTTKNSHPTEESKPVASESGSHSCLDSNDVLVEPIVKPVSEEQFLREISKKILVVVETELKARSAQKSAEMCEDVKPPKSTTLSAEASNKIETLPDNLDGSSGGSSEQNAVLKPDVKIESTDCEDKTQEAILQSEDSRSDSLCSVSVGARTKSDKVSRSGRCIKKKKRFVEDDNFGFSRKFFLTNSKPVRVVTDSSHEGEEACNKQSINGLPYQCSTCCKWFSSRQSLGGHRRQNCFEGRGSLDKLERNRKISRCLVCLRYFHTANAAIVHRKFGPMSCRMRFSTKEKIPFGPDCKLPNAESSAENASKITENSLNRFGHRNFTCKVCWREFRTPQALRTHKWQRLRPGSSKTFCVPVGVKSLRGIKKGSERKFIQVLPRPVQAEQIPQSETDSSAAVLDNENVLENVTDIPADVLDVDAENRSENGLLEQPVIVPEEAKALSDALICKVCGQKFRSTHALKVHIGKSRDTPHLRVQKHTGMESENEKSETGQEVVTSKLSMFRIKTRGNMTGYRYFRKRAVHSCGACGRAFTSGRAARLHQFHALHTWHTDLKSPLRDKIEACAQLSGRTPCAELLDKENRSCLSCNRKFVSFRALYLHRFHSFHVGTKTCVTEEEEKHAQVPADGSKVEASAEASFESAKDVDELCPKNLREEVRAEASTQKVLPTKKRRDWKCSVCNRNFRSSRSLRMHIIHSKRNGFCFLNTSNALHEDDSSTYDTSLLLENDDTNDSMVARSLPFDETSMDIHSKAEDTSSQQNNAYLTDDLKEDSSESSTLHTSDGDPKPESRRGRSSTGKKTVSLKSLYECVQCSTSYAYLKSLFRHVETAHGTADMKCEDCGLSFNSQQGMEIHCMTKETTLFKTPFLPIKSKEREHSLSAAEDEHVGKNLTPAVEDSIQSLKSSEKEKSEESTSEEESTPSSFVIGPAEVVKRKKEKKKSIEQCVREEDNWTTVPSESGERKNRKSGVQNFDEEEISSIPAVEAHSKSGKRKKKLEEEDATEDETSAPSIETPVNKRKLDELDSPSDSSSESSVRSPVKRRSAKEAKTETDSAEMAEPGTPNRLLRSSGKSTPGDDSKDSDLPNLEHTRTVTFILSFENKNVRFVSLKCYPKQPPDPIVYCSKCKRCMKKRQITDHDCDSNHFICMCSKCRLHFPYDQYILMDPNRKRKLSTDAANPEPEAKLKTVSTTPETNLISKCSTNRDILTDSNKIKKCALCGEVMNSFSKLEKHLKLVHTKLLTCLKCGTCFSETRTWENHVQLDTCTSRDALSDRDLPAGKCPEQYAVETDATGPEHVCDSCNKFFDSAEKLNEHCCREGSASSWKLFRCNSCSRWFQNELLLQTHKEGDCDKK